MQDVPRVSVLGAGKMGGAIVGTLCRAGFDVVVFNRTAERAEEVAESTGAEVAETVAAAVRDADIVLSSLADDAAVETVYLGSRRSRIRAHRGHGGPGDEHDRSTDVVGHRARDLG